MFWEFCDTWQLHLWVKSSCVARPAKAAAKPRRIQICTEALDMTCRRIAAAQAPEADVKGLGGKKETNRGNENKDLRGRRS